MTTYKKLDDDTLQASQALGDTGVFTAGDWGNAVLRRIFNFKARQVITLYERGGLKDYTQPRGDCYSSSETGYTAALTSAMQIQNFRDFESTDEIVEMHKRLVEKGGTPPALEILFPDDLRKPSLKPPGLP